MARNVLKKVVAVGLALCIVAGTALFTPLTVEGAYIDVAPHVYLGEDDDED